MSRKVLPWLTIPAAIVLLLGGCWWAAKGRYEHARAAWKTETLGRLAGLSITNEEISKELDGLKGLTPWTSDNVVRMTNGEFIIYAFWHGANSGFVHHLFLGHASDGRWLYSSYHFCNSMVAVSSDDPPGSIREFEQRYSVREFDGKSDECLQATWPN